MRLALAGALALSLLGAACLGEIGEEPGDPDAAFLFGTGGTGGAGGAGGSGGRPPLGGGGAGGDGGKEPPAPIPHLLEIPIGKMSSGDAGEIEVPAAALSLTLIARTAGAFDRLGFREIRAPGGEAIVSDYVLPGGAWEFAWYGATAAAVPQSDAPAAMPLEPGVWTFELGAPDDPSLGGQVTALVRQTEDGNFHGGAIDVNAFIAPGAAAEGYVLGVLAEAYEGFAGLELGEIAVYPLGQEHDVVESAVGFLRVLEETRAASARPSLSVLFVADLAGELEGAVGIAASIPGQGVVHGTHLSGVVAEVTGDPAVDVHVLRHETGHLSGLFHTSEIDRPLHDPLGDTPECDAVETMGLACPDAENLMFPYVGEGMNLSDKQARVLHGSSLYRGVVAEGGAPAPSGLLPAPSRSGQLSEAARRVSRKEALGRTPLGLRPSASFGAGVSAAAMAWLRGAHCALAPFDPASFSRSFPAVSAVDLRRLAGDPEAPPHVRERALEVLGERLREGRIGGRDRAGDLARLEGAVLDGGEPLRVRLGALRGLARVARDRLPALGERLGGGAPWALRDALRRAVDR